MKIFKTSKMEAMNLSGLVLFYFKCLKNCSPNFIFHLLSEKKDPDPFEGLRPPPLDWPSRARECGNARWLGSSDCQLVYTVTQSGGRGLGISGKRLRLMA